MLLILLLFESALTGGFEILRGHTPGAPSVGGGGGVSCWGFAKNAQEQPSPVRVTTGTHTHAHTHAPTSGVMRRARQYATTAAVVLASVSYGSGRVLVYGSAGILVWSCLRRANRCERASHMRRAQL